MSNDIYKIAKEFLKYENIMNKTHTEVYSWNEPNFTHITENNFPGFGFHIQTICKDFDNYTSTIVKDTTNSIKSSCMYLYYWLYYKNDNRNIENVKKRYVTLIKTDSTYHATLCKTYVFTTITEDIMPKLKDLHDFTPYILCFKRTLRRKRNKSNNIDEDYNMFQSCKIVSSATVKSRQNILYHNV
ncbi:variable surface protein [Plasmodium gonderi]|uniref:Variable surface protein n=1 Tax=Plasmodium gonderi TaxID=77519 RepID=A0A1Y1JS72_PLAGO|nr:variable surface protein [Plasmodium gonderi]GAW84298.1 variable surface protein [Plasmodium gonderi]